MAPTLPHAATLSRGGLGFASADFGFSDCIGALKRIAGDLGLLEPLLLVTWTVHGPVTEHIPGNPRPATSAVEANKT